MQPNLMATVFPYILAFFISMLKSVIVFCFHI